MGMISGKGPPIWQGIQDILFWCCIIFLSSSKDFEGLRLATVGVLQVLGEIRSSGLTQKEILPTKVLKYLIVIHSYRPWDKIKPMILQIFPELTFTSLGNNYCPCKEEWTIVKMKIQNPCTFKDKLLDFPQNTRQFRTLCHIKIKKL